MESDTESASSVGKEYDLQRRAFRRGFLTQQAVVRGDLEKEQQSQATQSLVAEGISPIASYHSWRWAKASARLQCGVRQKTDTPKQMPNCSGSREFRSPSDRKMNRMKNRDAESKA